MTHATEEQLTIRTDEVRKSPTDSGSVVMIVRRPTVDQREVLGSAELNVAEGIAGDNWSQRSSKRTDDGSPHPDMQLNLINSRVSAILADDPDQRALAGDQLHVDSATKHDNSIMI